MDALTKMNTRRQVLQIKRAVAATIAGLGTGPLNQVVTKHHVMMSLYPFKVNDAKVRVLTYWGHEMVCESRKVPTHKAVHTLFVRYHPDSPYQKEPCETSSKIKGISWRRAKKLLARRESSMVNSVVVDLSFQPIAHREHLRLTFTVTANGETK